MENFPDLPESPKKPKRKPVGLSSLTSSRIASQSSKSEVPKNTVPVPLLPANKRFHHKDPGRMPPIHRKHYQQSDLDPGLLSDSGPTASMSNAKTEPDQGNEDSTNTGSTFPKGAFTTTGHGFKIIKKIHYFKCPECGIHKKITMGLNEHYKRRHKPIPCGKCDMIFHTPSGYDRHKYMHLDPRYKCDQCDKNFHFLGELCQHSTVHSKNKTYV